jgi:prolyl-tRNA synthetase
MKDMYSFDLDDETAMDTYKQVQEAYDWFFQQVGLPFVIVSPPLAFLNVGGCSGR